MRPKSVAAPARLLAAGLLTLAVSIALGCGGPQQMPPAPQNAPPQNQAPQPVWEEPPARPPQVLLPPPPPAPRELKPLPRATRRVAVVVTERLGEADKPRRDPESEPILAEALLAAGNDLHLEVVKQGVYQDILDRDLEALSLRGAGESARLFQNLFQAGVDLLALAEIGGSNVEKEVGRGRTVTDRVQVHAGVQLVRTDDAGLLAVGNAPGQARTAQEAKTQAIQEASRKMVEAWRNRQVDVELQVYTLTVDGLPGYEEAARIERGLRGLEGVLWTRDLRFIASAPGTPGGVARYEVAWESSAEHLRQSIARLDTGVPLVIVKMEGNRWSFHAAPRQGQAPPGPAPSGAPRESK